MKKIILTICFCLITSISFAQLEAVSREKTQEYWVYVRLEDRSGVTAEDDNGRSKRGDVVDVVKADGTNIPSKLAKEEWLIYKASLTKKEKEAMKEPWVEIIDGKEVFKAYRKNKLDTSKLGIVVKKGLVPTKIDGSKIIVKEKTSYDLSRYEFKRYIYLTKRPFAKWYRGLDDYWVKPAYALTEAACGSAVADREVVCTINKSGEDYPSLTTWEDAVDGDLVGNQQIQRADVYDDDGDLSGTVVVDGSTTSNTTYYMIITAPEGERHTGTAGTGATVTSDFGAGGGIIISLMDEGTRVSWLEVKVGATGDADTGLGVRVGNKLSNSAGFNQVSNCLIYPSADYGADDNDFVGIEATYHQVIKQHTFKNNIIYGFNQVGGIGIFLNATAPRKHIGIRLYNNTITDCDKGIEAISQLTGSIRTWTANNLVTNCGTYCYDDAHVNDNGIFYNDNENDLSDDGTAFYLTQADSGAVDTDTTNHLIQAGQNFITTVFVGMRVRNTTDSTWGYVTVINSDTDLTLNIDLVPDGKEAYIIYKAYVNRTIAFNDSGSNDYHLGISDTQAMDLATDLGTTNGINFDIDNFDRDAEAVDWDIGADEFVAAGGAVTGSTQPTYIIGTIIGSIQ